MDVTHGNGARFTRNIEDTAKRTIFKQGETYVLTEETVFANGDSLPTNKISTILGQSVNVEGIASRGPENQSYDLKDGNWRW